MPLTSQPISIPSSTNCWRQRVAAFFWPWGNCGFALMRVSVANLPLITLKITPLIENNFKFNKWGNGHIVPAAYFNCMETKWSRMSSLVTVVTLCPSWHMWSQHNYHKLARGTPGPTKNRYYKAIFPILLPVTRGTLVQPKVGIIWSFSQNYYQLPSKWTNFNFDPIFTGQQSDCKTCVLRCASPQVKM